VNLVLSARFETQLIGQPVDQLIGTASKVTTRMALGQTRGQPSHIKRQLLRQLQRTPS